jgi:hypothetical protein
LYDINGQKANENMQSIPMDDGDYADLSTLCLKGLESVFISEAYKQHSSK